MRSYWCAAQLAFLWLGRKAGQTWIFFSNSHQTSQILGGALFYKYLDFETLLDKFSVRAVKFAHVHEA